MAADPAEAVLEALRSEGASGEGYRWPDRSCVSLIRALCRALGVPEPAYGPWLALSERDAGAKALAEYGGMGPGHQAGLLATGHWEAVEPPARAGDVVSWEGVVRTANGTVYAPPAPWAHGTGICGIHGFRWLWTLKGLDRVEPGPEAFVTRVKPCRSE